MTDKRRDVTVSPETVTTHVEVFPVRVLMRNYFSTHLLWAARHFGQEAAVIESRHEGDSRFDIEHRAAVLGAVTSSAAFLEAMINELFQDASDGHGTAGDGYLAPLAARTHELMAGWWAESGEGFEKVLRKYQMLLLFCDEPILDRGAEPYQSADLVIKLRNTIMHYRSETVSADVEHRLAKGLRGRFPDNLLMTGSGNAWWPDHALGAGCADWAFKSVKALADHVSHAVGIVPNYQRHRGTWFADTTLEPEYDEMTRHDEG